MSLIDEVEKLRGLEQATREDTEISSPIDDSDYLERLVDVAPAMLAALSMIQEGDAEKLEAAANWLKTTNANQVIIEAMDRAVHMAALMEKEEQ